MELLPCFHKLFFNTHCPARFRQMKSKTRQLLEIMNMVTSSDDALRDLLR